MKKTNIIYWIATGLFSLAMVASAIPGILNLQMAYDGFRQMGYPAYLVPFLSYAKLLGVIAILVPGFPKIKEWAYAGLVFDLVGAAYTVIALGAPGNSVMMLILLVLGFVSYGLYHSRIRNAKAASKAEPVRRLAA